VLLATIGLLIDNQGRINKKSENTEDMKLINHQNEVFSISISDYMLPFKPDQYFENNWLKGNIEISSQQTKHFIQLETLQVEELVNLLVWIDQLIDKEKGCQTIFYFIDPNMKFRLWKRGRTETIRFIYHSEKKNTYSWEMIVNDKNVANLKKQINEILFQYTIR